jgi:hypothetical protein
MTTSPKPTSYFAPKTKSLPIPEPSASGPTTKRGTHQISGMFPPEVFAQWNMLAAELRIDKRELLARALNLAFEANGKPPIAR